MSSIRRRAALGVAALIAIAGPLVAAPSSHAGTCEEVDIYRAGNKTPVGSCSGDPGPGDFCTGTGLAPLGYGAGVVACVHMPVAAAS